MEYARGDYYVKKYIDDDGNSALEIVDETIYDDFFYYLFENGSILLEKFEEKMKGITKSGITMHWDNLEKKKVNSNTGSLFDNIKDQQMVQRLVIVLIIGYFMSIVTFVFENLINKYF